MGYNDNKKNEVLLLINDIWTDVFPAHNEPENHHLKVLIKSLSRMRDSVNSEEQEYSYGTMHSLLKCIKYAINKNSSTHKNFYSYLNDFNKMQDRTFIEWVYYFKRN